jgi:3-hydroxyisobutyrate dehydrogenase-like beta-hydroxyacid dehydrogenase
VAPSEVGFVGLGNMGMAMARRLPAAGHQVGGYDAPAELMREIAGVEASAESGLRVTGARAKAPFESPP